MHAVSTNRIADILHFNDNKQIFHAVLFNIKNYSPEVINITTQSGAEYYITEAG